MQTIRVREAGGVTTITLNRPEVMNALSGRMRAEVTAALTAAHGGRGIVLTGEGRAFCSGQDLTDAGSLDVEATLRDEYVPMPGARPVSADSREPLRPVCVGRIVAESGHVTTGLSCGIGC